MEHSQGFGSGRGTFFNKVAFAVLSVVTFLLPIFFVPVSFIGVQFGTSLLFAFGVILGSLLYIVAGLLSGSLDLPHPGKWILGSMAVVPVIYALAGVQGGFSRMPFFGYTFDVGTVGFIVLGFIYLFLVSVLFRGKKAIFYSYVAFVVSSILLSVFLLVRVLFGADVLSFDVFKGITDTMVGNWNNTGIFFGIGLLLSVMTYQMLHLSKMFKILLSIAIFLSLFFLVLVNFSALWIVLAISSLLLVLYGIFNAKSTPTHTSRFSFYSVAVFVVSLIFVIWGAPIGNQISNVFHISNVDVRPSFATTMEIARNTIRMKPLFGSGPNNFLNEWLTWKPDEIITSDFWNTDFTNGIGLIPTFAVTTGIMGILSWLVFLGFYIYLGVKAIFAKTEDSFVKYLITSSFFVSLYLWIMAFVYVPSAVIFILTFFFTGLFLASLCLSGTMSLKTKVFSSTPREGFIFSLIMVAFIVGGVALSYGLFKSSQSLWYFQKSSYALNTSGDLTSSENYMRMAIETVPHDIYYRSLSEIELAKLNMVVSQDTKKVKQADIQKQFSDVLQSAITAAIGAKDADPTNYLNWIALGKVYETVSAPQLKIQGAYESAQLAYSEALRRNPKNPAILAIFARLALGHEDLKTARQYVMQAIQAKQNYLDAYFLLSQIEVADKNIKGAIDSVTAASVLSPTDPAIFFQLGLLKYNNRDFDGAISAFTSALKLTPDYANAKYFLGLSYDAVGQPGKALEQFTQLKVTNPDSAEVNMIIENLRAGRRALSNAPEPAPEKAKKLPVKEKTR